jgi:hypothetical protein
MTHLALRLTTRSEARNTSTSCFTSNKVRSKVRSEESSCFTSNSEVRSKDHTASCFTSNSEVRSMTHLALRLTARSEARNKYICSPFQGGSFRTIPSLSRKCSNFTRDRGLVNTSATCSSVLMYWSFKAPLYTMSQMK